MASKSPYPLLAGLMEPVHTNNQGAALLRGDLLHQKRGAGTAFIGVLTNKAVPKAALNILVICNDREPLLGGCAEPGIDRLRHDTANDQPLHTAVQQAVQRCQIAVGVPRGCKFYQSFQTVLLGIGNAAVDPLPLLALCSLL